MRKNLKDFKGKDAIFIDANIFLHHAFDTNAISVEFLNRIELFHLKAYTSALVLEEVSFKLFMQSASNYLNTVTVQSAKDFLRSDKNRRLVLKPVLEYVQYLSFLKESGMVIIDLKDSDTMTAVQKSLEYGLLTADAAHLAVMERKGIRHIATGDNDFTAAPHIFLWSPFV